MTSAKGRVVRWLGRLLLEEATVAEVSRPGPDFCLVRLDAAERVRAAVLPGDKVQILLPSDDVRTWTPVRLPDGALALLGHVRPEGPAGRWLTGLRVGDPVRLAGPRRSLRLPDGPVVMIGDETSLAVAASYAFARPGAVRALFELGPGVDASGALGALGLSGAVFRRGADTDPALLDAAASAGAAVAITGGGELIQRVRTALRARGVRSPTVKAYWIAGRSGLD